MYSTETISSPLLCRAAATVAGLLSLTVPVAWGGDIARRNQQHGPQQTSCPNASRAGPPGVFIEPSRRMRAEGFKWDHEIRIALPHSYHETNKAYPVLWVTDGSYWFNTAV